AFGMSGLTVSLQIRPAGAADRAAIWSVLEPVVRAGETYALPRDMPEADLLEYWFAPGHAVFVAETGGAVVGTYFIRVNQRGGGDHVANASYATKTEQRGRGIAKAMGLHSLAEARER